MMQRNYTVGSTPCSRAMYTCLSPQSNERLDGHLTCAQASSAYESSNSGASIRSRPFQTRSFASAPYNSHQWVWRPVYRCCLVLMDVLLWGFNSDGDQKYSKTRCSLAIHQEHFALLHKPDCPVFDGLMGPTTNPILPEAILLSPPSR